MCEGEARGVCAACGRGLCHSHAHIHDELTLAKSDTSTETGSPPGPGSLGRVRFMRSPRRLSLSRDPNRNFIVAAVASLRDLSLWTLNRKHYPMPDVEKLEDGRR